MCINITLTSVSLFSSLASALGSRYTVDSGLHLAFSRAIRHNRHGRSPLTPDILQRISELEGDLDISDTESPEIHVDRGLGGSYASIHKISGDISPGSVTKESLDDSALSDTASPVLSDADKYRSQYGDECTDIPFSSDVDDTLLAATHWGSDANRYRNSGELVDDISNEEMVGIAQAELRRERMEGPNMKELIASLEEPRVKPSGDAWKNLVQQFDIATDASTCIGCGIRLQSGNLQSPGYIDPLVMASIRESGGHARCRRCSSMSSGLIFNNSDIAVGADATDAARETVAIIRNALSLNATRNVTVVYMLDALDIHFEDGLAELIASRRAQRTSDSHFYIVLNKVDLLPPHSRKRLIAYVHRYVKSRAPDLGLKPRHIFLLSSRTGSGVNLFLSVLLDDAYRRRSKIFFVGATNTGKSTFINRLSNLVSCSDERKSDIAASKRALLSTSVVPGTTLRPLRIDTGPGFEMYDTPGIVVPNAFTSYLTPDELKMAVPASLGAAKPLRVACGSSLLIGPFVRIDVTKGRPWFFTPYFSKRVKVAVVRTNRIAQFLSKSPFGDARIFYGTECEDGILTSDESNTSDREGPLEGSVDDIRKHVLPNRVDTTRHQVNVVGSGWDHATSDLCFKGLGFIALAGALELSICIETCSGVGVYMREPLMPFDAIPFARKKLRLKDK
ncbi:YlqF_related_GTPase family protein [Babesia bovis T2Bo]|uniref:Membrane protein, putative n=1 Tax=Babesia bovis TaxID=5865 RepID=A7AUH8_BABBO|nr:YlqF_related_GTPase family protein [Babesia bovis T2Bo]EDO06589.1 YlqF_related_GTPase family protein [Babesia bovis T2Bo]|eukprot:XP_001610157.1 membrane protein [Babesia bovis T2Bo]